MIDEKNDLDSQEVELRTIFLNIDAYRQTAQQKGMIKNGKLSKEGGDLFEVQLRGLLTDCKEEGDMLIVSGSEIFENGAKMYLEFSKKFESYGPVIMNFTGDTSGAGGRTDYWPTEWGPESNNDHILRYLGTICDMIKVLVGSDSVTTGVAETLKS